jgi:hypothetical protein
LTVAKYILKNGHRAVTRLPKSVRKKSIFLVNLNDFDFDDLKADDNGSWAHNGVGEKYYTIENAFSNKITQKINPLNLKNSRWPSDFPENAYRIRRYSYESKANPVFIRKYVRMDDKDAQFDKCLLLYYWKNEKEEQDQPFSTPCHGNASNSSTSYIRSEKSTLDKVIIFFRFCYA